MRTNLILAAMAVFALTSCSKDETKDINTGVAESIGFRASLGKATRGTETDITNLKEFVVTAFHGDIANTDKKIYYSNVVYSKVGESGNTFTSNPAYHWPQDGSALTFYAWSPAVGEGGLSGTMNVGEGLKILEGFSPETEVKDQKDFIIAIGQGNKNANQNGLNLTFKHALSQIELKAKNDNGGYDYKVKGVKIAYPQSEGNYAFPNKLTTDEKYSGLWMLQTDNAIKACYTVEYENAILLTTEAASIMGPDAGTAMLIPQQLTGWVLGEETNVSKGAYLAVKVNVTTKDGAQVFPYKEGEYDWVAVPIATKWEEGSKYIYTLDFSNGPGYVDPDKPEKTDPEDKDPFEPGKPVLPTDCAIQFTVTVDEWTDADQVLPLTSPSTPDKK